MFCKYKVPSRLPQTPSNLSPDLSTISSIQTRFTIYILSFSFLLPKFHYLSSYHCIYTFIMMQIALERPVTVAHASVSTEINEAVSPSSFSITDTESSDGDSDTEGDETVPLASSERPTNWLTGSYSGLCKVVARAEGAASNQVVSYIKK